MQLCSLRWYGTPRYCDIFSIEIKNKKLLPNGVAQWVRAFTTNES